MTNDDKKEKKTPDNEKERKNEKKHLIRPKWLRVVVKTFFWIIVAIILIPVALYLPPVQTLVKNIACKVVYDSTGMKVDIEKFRLKFPVDVSLQGVSVLYASGDTMVNAREALVDVKLLPLLKLDVELNKLRLSDGYYKMVSPDSSMIMTLRAGFLDANAGSSISIARSEILLDKVLLKNGDVDLYMDVWKKQTTPQDTASTPFLIKANDLRLENIRFSMSMLPTIDSLAIEAGNLALKKGVIDLRSNSISFKHADIDNGSATYLTPTPEYIASHPVPVDTTQSGPPMVIKGDSISLSGFSALYAVKGAKPLPGFDASYISVSGVSLGMKDFYNEASTIRLPITSLQAKERSGLQIVEGNGTVGVDSVGLSLQDMFLKTLYSQIDATADVPFAMMELDKDSPMACKAKGWLGMPDIEAFMPDLKEYTSKLTRRNPLDFDIDANGSLRRLVIDRLDARMAGVVSLKASGYAENPMEIKRLVAAVDFEGALEDPSMVDKIMGKSPVRIPHLSISGNATASEEEYGADFKLLTDAGDVAANGRVNLNSEGYDADVELHGLDVDYFMPGTGIGAVTGRLRANGAGFNPLTGHAHTDARIDIVSILVNKNLLKNIEAKVLLEGGAFNLSAVSGNPDLDLYLEGNGTIAPDNYTFDISANIKNADLERLGFSQTMNRGNGDIHLVGTASPDKWIYDARLDVSAFDWNLPGQYIHLPAGLTATMKAMPDGTKVEMESLMTNLSFTSESGLKRIVDGFMAAGTEIERQIADRQLAVDTLRQILPPFRLDLNASGRGLLAQFLSPMGMGVDTVYAHLSNDTIISGNAGVLSLNTGTMLLDTIHLDLKERGRYLDYIASLGNRKGNLDEFAKVTARGYLGNNRGSLYLNQFNSKGENGYRIGLTASFVDSIINVHFTPLRSTIAYLPWTFNDDNYVEYNMNNRKVEANLLAKSAESSILVKTEPTDKGRDALHLKLDNIKVQDFLSMSVFAPPVTASVNSDLRVIYDGEILAGGGSINVSDFTYDHLKVGDLDLDLKAGMRTDGNSRAAASLKINGQPALTTTIDLARDSTGLEPEDIQLTLTDFPLSVANPFLGNDVASLSGYLKGQLKMDGKFSAPRLNGEIGFDSVGVYIPMAGTTLKFDNQPIPVKDNVITFDDFDIFAVNKNPLVIDGTIDATSFSAIGLNLGMKAQNIQLVGNDKRAGTDIYGKLFMNLDATAKGNLHRLDVRATAGVLGTTDVTYVMQSAQTSLSDQTDKDIVKFVNFNDTTQVVKADTVPSIMNLRIVANLNIEPGTEVQVDLSSNGTDKVQLTPSGTLSYFQNYMGDMRLNGQLSLGNGFARYAIPVVGERTFTFDENSTVLWNGDVMNPVLNIHATDLMKANVSTSGNARMVNFLVALNVTNTLSAPKIAFDLSTNDDLDVQNELESMTPDQRSNQAMNLLLYGQYTGQNTKMSGGNMAGNMLYGFLESQLNSWAANHIRGVDLSFGIDQYNQTTDGNTSTTTSYSYQVSKSLFSNRFKILVGGNYSTDASADENFSENLISDVSFEYILKQTQTLNMAVKLYRHTGYESILEGEITETGVGFVMKRKMGSLRRLFHFLRRGKKNSDEEEVVRKDTLKEPEPIDSIETQNQQEL